MLPTRRFNHAIQTSKIALTAELSLRHGTTARELLAQAECLRNAVDGIQVSDNPHAWIQLSPVAAAALLLQHGIDPVPQLSCRDRNRIALQSDLLGLKALGVSSVLLSKGSPIPQQSTLQARQVFEVSCRELVGMAAALNEAEDSSSADDVLLGTGIRIFNPGPDWNGEMLLARAGTGARFLQTQLCFDTGMLRRYMQRLVEMRITWKYAVIVSLAPLPSAATARWLLENSPGCVIPDQLVQQLQSSADAEQEGIAICAGLLREMAAIPGVSGFNIHTLGNAGAVLAALRESGLTATTS